jgi:hypothetical protein
MANSSIVVWPLKPLSAEKYPSHADHFYTRIADCGVYLAMASQTATRGVVEMTTAVSMQQRKNSWLGTWAVGSSSRKQANWWTNFANQRACN